jgi:hypothetical protein
MSSNTAIDASQVRVLGCFGGLGPMLFAIEQVAESPRWD